MKKYFAIALLLIALSGCSPLPKQTPFIATTIYPLTDITQRICGNNMEVRQIIPPGIEPHEWDPSPAALKNAQAAALLVAVGPMLEPTAKLTGATQQIFFSNTAIIEKIDGAIDPHMWLDPQNVIRFIPELVAKLSLIDATHADSYRQNGNQLIAELTALDNAYTKSLSSSLRKDFVTTHAAFGYVATRYGLTQHSILGNTPEEEPSAKHINELTTFCKTHQISTIFYEPRESEKLAERFASEINATTLPLDPLEMAPPSENKAQGYIAIMRLNLEQLVNGLNR